MSDRVAALAERVVKKARAAGVKLATAESCTAGSLATLLADTPGGGEQFHGGFVTYTKENKMAALGVPRELIAAHTAVSRPVAEAMATGALDRCPADLVIAITGVAGPEPDEDGNPVGLMHIAAAVRGRGIRHRSHTCEKGGRDETRTGAMCAALELADEMLEEIKSSGAGQDERT
jgi:nicotinamide-nucleotide amidase